MPVQNIATVLNAINALEFLSRLVSEQMEQKKATEQEKTRRREVGAWELTTCFDRVASAHTEYVQIAEHERTKRGEIEAWEQTTLAKINAQRDLLIAYLDRSFDERARNFQALFNGVDQAIAAGNHEQLALTLNSIVDLAKSSPFKELADLASVRAKLNDPDHEWTF